MRVLEEPAGTRLRGGQAGEPADAPGQVSLIEVVAVPRWQEGTEASVLPRALRFPGPGRRRPTLATSTQQRPLRAAAGHRV